MKLVLASSSPRRRELLKLFGIPFEILPSEAEERDLTRGLKPEAAILLLASLKALKIEAEGEAVVAADTAVVAGGKMLSKPKDEREAREMLLLLRGGAHKVVSGVAARRGDMLCGEICTSVLVFKPFSEGDLREYLAEARWEDKAGAFAIQEGGLRLISHYEGCYYNIVGLPLCALRRALARIGFLLPPPQTLPEGCARCESKSELLREER